jgi:hypothetical protein
MYDIIPQFKSLVVLSTAGAQYNSQFEDIRFFIVLVLLAAIPAPLLIVVLVWCLGRCIFAHLTIRTYGNSLRQCGFDIG